jgi:FAD/FMN-containing dehydrogenase/Fe-S oxidoreductase
MISASDWHELAQQFAGEIQTDPLWQALYATDASVYQERPLGVVFPKTVEDLQAIVRFARKHQLGLIPRGGGTSLAGQCVGSGLVVDLSRHFTQIEKIQPEERVAWVQPGVIRDQLNRAAAPYGLFFGPNTSTTNRCTLGGMVGNNSCGSTSIVYGTTRDKIREVKAVLSDGSLVTFGPISTDELAAKQQESNLEGEIYRELFDLLQDPANQQEIRDRFPRPEIHRRNTGYALDVLLQSQPFQPNGPPFNPAQLMCGSEGTLALIYSLSVALDPLPPAESILVAAHFRSVQKALTAVLRAMNHPLFACELMDKTILDCTKGNRQQEQNRFFLQGDPGAILLLELRNDDPDTLNKQAESLITDLQQAGLGYAFPQLRSPESDQAWELRKAGLGVLSHLPNGKKAISCVEDTAVALADLPSYIDEFRQLMATHGQKAIYHAHAGAGELHLRPLLNLRDPQQLVTFQRICQDTAALVRKYRGSLSGEHGDGRVRSPFLAEVMGERVLSLFTQVKAAFDPDSIFNPGKIVDPQPLTKDLRFHPEQSIPKLETVYDFSAEGGIIGLTEKCNGSGDCRKLEGGTMCPSYRATRSERDSTRARANALRTFLSQPNNPRPFDHPELKEVLDLCLSCKACTSECPSSVDMTTLKSEFLYQYHRSNRRPIRDYLFGHIDRIHRVGSRIPGLTNALLSTPLTARLIKKVLQIAPERTLPRIAATSFDKWYLQVGHKLRPDTSRGKVWLYCDEFNQYQDPHIPKAAVQLLTRLGYQVHYQPHPISGRALFSKGFLGRAQKLAKDNVRFFSERIQEDMPLVGLEPSAILSFRDEYLRLVGFDQQAVAQRLSRHCFSLTTFLWQEVEKGKIEPDQFTHQRRQIYVHGHCHQKSIGDLTPLLHSLSLPTNYEVEYIPAGCCGMAGSFGYEKEHYAISQQVGEETLFPALREVEEEALICAPGTSCRHQIRDGVEREALHPVEILLGALNPKFEPQV